jgi:hypothetical protein
VRVRCVRVSGTFGQAAEERGAGKGETRAGAGELVELAEAYLAHPRSWRPNADVPPPPSRAGSLTRAYSLYPLSPRAARALFGLVAAEATEAAATAAATDDGDPDAALRRSIAGRMPFLLPTVATARDNLASVHPSPPPSACAVCAVDTCVGGAGGGGAAPRGGALGCGA